ncbi:MAG: Ig-like domain-containing protein [Clostridia bacterium]|nr:Ig-like domain-containing protein [Clostridia bacterium]
MKKLFIAFILLLTLTVTAISVSADADCIVADASELITTVKSSSLAGMVHNTELVYDALAGRSFVGGYPNGVLDVANDNTGLRFVLTELFDGYNAKDYPYIKVGYKALIASNKNTDVNVGVSYNGTATRLWGKRVTIDNSGAYNSVIIDLKSYTSAEHAAADVYSFDSIDEAPVDYIYLKPYYSKKSISKEDYLMVEYIGAFKSEADALAYVHPAKASEIEISINYTAFRLSAGESFTIKPAVKGLEGAEFTFKSADQTIATIDASGKVAALKNGITTVSASYGEETVECMVVVGKPEAISLVKYDVFNYGKLINVNALGDSITSYSAPNGRVYHVWWSQNYNIKNRNYGVGGTKISVTAGAEEDKSFQARALTMEENADLITVKGGVNDWFGNVPLGEKGTRLNTTFEGGLRNLIEILIKRYPEKQIVFFTPIKCLRTCSNTLPLTDYVDRVLSVCAEYGIPAIDIYNSPETDFTDTPELFYDGDLHPNDEAEGMLGEYMMNQMVAKGIVTVSETNDFKPVPVGEHFAFDEEELYNLVSVPSGISKSLSDGKVKITADSEVSNAQVTVSFENEDILLKTYNVVRVDYKTNINSIKGTATVDFNIQTTYDKDGTRKSFTLFSYKPTFKSSAQDEIFVDALEDSSLPNSSLGSGIGYNNADELSEYDKLVLKLWYDNGNKSVKDTYFEIESIGFYKSVEEAYSVDFDVNKELLGIEVPAALGVEQGTITKLDVKLNPTTAQAKLAYESKNDSVARVTADGKIIALAPGQATIKVTADDGKYTGDCVVTVTAPAKDYSQYIFDRDNLENLVYKVIVEKKLNVVYLGGSVTAGAGASVADTTSWRGLTGVWLKNMFPDVEVNLHNSAMGGSGSMLGAFRTDVDVLAHDPDLVFVEFAVNDSYSKHYADGTVQLYYESIIRQIREKSPETEIISIYVTDKGLLNQTDTSPIAKLQETVAAHYGVTGIDVGRAMNNHITSTGGTWEEYVKDSVHPLDKGYVIYADVIKQYLFAKLFGADEVPEKPIEHTVPETYIDERNIDFVPTYVKVTENTFTDVKGWTYSANKAFNNLDSEGYIYPSANDNSFTYKFKGTGIAFFMEFNGGGYYVEWTLDGGQPQNIYLTDTNHAFNKMYKTGVLEDTWHTLTFSYKGADGTGGTNPNVKITRILVSQIASEEPEVLLGDVDGNGIVEPTDGVAIARYNAKWTGYGEDEINLANSDVDGVGGVDATDGVILSRYFAKWAGYETLPYVPAE